MMETEKLTLEDRVRRMDYGMQAMKANIEQQQAQITKISALLNTVLATVHIMADEMDLDMDRYREENDDEISNRDDIGDGDEYDTRN